MMKAPGKPLAHGVSFKLIGYGSILQVYYHDELWMTVNLLVYYRYIADTVERMKKEMQLSENDDSELTQ